MRLFTDAPPLTPINAAVVEGPRLVICPVCKERIGIYEPMAVIREGGMHTTSRAREPDLPCGDAIVVHAGCATPTDAIGE